MMDNAADEKARLELFSSILPFEAIFPEFETVYANGNFKNVNEVHNNTGSMTLSGFNQEGGKVTGNIGKLIVESRQNTSTTTGSSSGIGVGISG